MKKTKHSVIHYFLHDMKFKNKFMITHLILVLVPTLVVFLFLYRRLSHIITVNTIESEQALVSQTADTLEATVSQLRLSMNSITSTSDTIDTFLSRFGRQDAPVSKAAEEIGTDYTDKQFDDNNANSVNNVNNVNNDLNDLNVPTDTPPENLASANEYIKKRDYQTALEIIMRISLNNPEKSIYFADQIRFLKKLILNQTKKTNCGS